MAKNKIYSLKDVQDWKELKKDELDLEKLKLHAEQDEVKSAFAKGIGKILLHEGLVLLGEKLLILFLKSLVKTQAKKSDSQENEEEEN